MARFHLLRLVENGNLFLCVMLAYMQTLSVVQVPDLDACVSRASDESVLGPD
jgi:hypothetical protein